MGRGELVLFLATMLLMVSLSWIALLNIRAQVELASIEKGMCRDHR